MKSRFEKLAALAKETAQSAGRKYPSAHEALNRAATSTLAAGKSAREALDIAVEKSGEMIRDATDHEYTKAATAKIKDMAIASATELQKMAVRGVSSTKGVTEDHSISDPSSAHDIEIAIHKLKGGDKVGQAGEVMGVVGGAVAGASAAGAVAAAAGATTILGSTTLGGILGGVFVAATPIGWIVGTAVVAGAAGYGIAKMIRSGSQQDIVREEMIERLKLRVASVQGTESEQLALDELLLSLPVALKNGLVTEEQAERMIGLVEKGALSATVALTRIKGIIAPK